MQSLLLLMLLVCCAECISNAIDNNYTEKVFNETNYDSAVINVDEFNGSEELPFNVVPEISDYERDFIRVLSEKYLTTHQPFDLSQIPAISGECREHWHKFTESLKLFELWALKIHDASGRFTSGLLNGNVNQLGDFDQCVNAHAPTNEFRGKYCLAYLQPKVPAQLKYTSYLRRLVQSHDAFKSNFDDPGHRVPRFSTINLGMCMPSSCSSDDFERILSHYSESFTNGTGIEIDVRVESEMCYVKDDEWMSKLDGSTKIAILFCVVLVICTIISTLYDYETGEQVKDDWKVSFSLIKNTKSLFSLNRDANDIRVAHAIRFLNAIMLVVSHKCMAAFYNPYSNRTQMSELLGRPFSVLARAASLYTDPFLMLSGMLTAYSLVGKLQRGSRINILKEYAMRYFRIMPPLAFLILFCTFILPLMGSGPQWNQVVAHHAGICKQYWWRNLLFIHNWFGFTNMCLTHTHHVGIDTELFWMAPFLIIALYKWPKRGLHAIVALAVASTIARYYVTYAYDLSNYVSFGISLKQLFKTADLMYTLPPHRFTVYSMGIILGYVLRKFRDLKLSKKQIKIGWYVSITSFMLAFFGPAPMGDISYKFNATHAAYYAAFAPIAWCIFFGWVILISQFGHANNIIKALEWRGFLVCTRISYALYLVQFPVFFFNVGQVKSSIQFSFPSTQVNLNEISCIILISIAFTILIEYPCNNIKDLIFNRKKIVEKKQCDSNLLIKED